MNKMIINHIEKLIVTSDAATIIKELEVEHPAAKLMVLASEMQEAEVGDGTNFVIIFAGALLEAAEDRSKGNIREAVVVNKIISSLIQSGLSEKSIGIITPYALQVKSKVMKL